MSLLKMLAVAGAGVVAGAVNAIVGSGSRRIVIVGGTVVAVILIFD